MLIFQFSFVFLIYFVIHITYCPWNCCWETWSGAQELIAVSTSNTKQTQGSGVRFLPQTLLLVQPQLRCSAFVRTPTDNRTTACVCRRSCCRAHTSSWGRRRRGTCPPTRMRIAAQVLRNDQSQKFAKQVTHLLIFPFKPRSSAPFDWTWSGIHHHLLNSTGDPAHRRRHDWWTEAAPLIQRTICINPHITVGLTVHLTTPVWSTLKKTNKKDKLVN